GVTTHGLAGRLELCHDLVHAGTFGEEDVDVADLVHDGPQALGLGLDVQGELGDEHRVDVPPLLGQTDPGDPLLGVQPRAVCGGGRSRQPAAVPAHDLVHDEHARPGTVLADDVLGEVRRLLG